MHLTKILILFALLSNLSFAKKEELALTPMNANIHNTGTGAKVELMKNFMRKWHSTDTYLTWDIEVTKATTIKTVLIYAHGRASGSELLLNNGEQNLTAVTTQTKNWGTYEPLEFGNLELKPGKQTITLKATKPADYVILNFRKIRLIGDTTGIKILEPTKKITDIKPPAKRAPGFGAKLEAPHPAMTVTDLSVPGLTIKAGGIDFLSDGTMVVSSWTEDGSIYFIKNYSGKPEDMKVSLFASGLAEPLGIEVVNDRIFICQKQELTELIDHDKDGKCDEYRCVSNIWDVSTNFHEFTFGPIYHEGKLLVALAIAINPGGATTKPQQKNRGTCIAVDPETGKFEIVAAGLRTPNGINITSKGEILINDNQGDWLPSSKMVHIRQDGFYHHKYTPQHSWADRKPHHPVVWQPQNEIGNSPSEPIEIPTGIMKGQILHGDIHHGGLKRVFMEEINGALQGALFRHAQKIRGGVNRLAWGPDGNLYVGIAGHKGNWGYEERDGLVRVSYDKAYPFEMLAVRAKSNGLEIEFTEPIADKQGWDPNYYAIDTFRYQPTIKYGGPKLDKAKLTPESISVSEDRKRVFLKLPNLKPNHIIHIELDTRLQSESSKPIYAGEVWYNMNNIPADNPGRESAKPADAIAIEKKAEIKESRIAVIHKSYCASCHSIDGKKLVGPSFKGLFGKKQIVIKDGKKAERIVDEDYIRRGIINPSAEYPEGYQPIMPQTLHESLTKSDIDELVKWIKSLK